MILPGAVGADAAGNNGWNAELMVNEGVTFCTVYVCQQNAATSWKIIKPEKCNELRAAGLTVIFNYEWYTQRPLEGDGAQDATVAVEMALGRGIKPGEYLLCSVDFNAGAFTAGGKALLPDQLPVVAKYLRDFARVLAQYGIRLGVYAGGWCIRWLIDNGGLPSDVLWWQPKFAWSAGSVPGTYYIPPEVHIVQAGQRPFGGVNSDINTVIRAFDPQTSSDIPVPPVEDDVELALVRFGGKEEIFLGYVVTSKKSGAKLLWAVQWIGLDQFGAFSAHCDFFDADFEAVKNCLCIGDVPAGYTFAKAVSPVVVPPAPAVDYPKIVGEATTRVLTTLAGRTFAVNGTAKLG